MEKLNSKKEADVCLVLEGTYPYIKGGVSTWTHELIKSQKHLNFHIVAFLPPHTKPKMRYELPKNVIEITNINLQQLPKKAKSLDKEILDKLFMNLEIPLLNIQYESNLKELQKIGNLLLPLKEYLNTHLLLNSENAWKMLVRMYNSTMGNSPFLDFFWTFRALFGGLFSIMCAPLPKAKIYHGLCTGYAGLYLARSHLETKKPCMVTEHGIYTNERRIEIATAGWLDSGKSVDFNIKKDLDQRDLRDFWIDSFAGYSKLCYEACEEIITIHEGNKKFQIADGADEKKISVIPNGIDYEQFAKIKKEKNKQPTIALIGRVVPIKDIKTYISACDLLKDKIENLQAYIIGPAEEDDDYYQECVDMVKRLNLENVVTFTGLVALKDYLGKIDLLVLTSISEAQPLVILEAGAAGVPCVVTDVGACREMVFGKSDEIPALGAGGDVCPLTDYHIIASSIEKLLKDKQYYEKCSKAIKERVKKYYNKKDLDKKYRDLYGKLLHLNA